MLEKITRILKASKLYQSRGSVTLENNVTKDLTFTVPEGKKWLVYAIMMHNGDDVQRTVLALVRDGSDNNLHELGSMAISAGGMEELLVEATSVGSYKGMRGFPIKGGNKLFLRWLAGGTSSGGTSYYCITYEEMLE